MVNKINPITWYSERELNYTPKHFITSQTKITNDSKLWIYNNLQGRFSIIQKQENTDSLYFFDIVGVPAFEDPKEAVMYELKWA